MKKEENKSKVQSTKPVAQAEKKLQDKNPEIDAAKSVIQSDSKDVQTQKTKEDNKSKVQSIKPTVEVEKKEQEKKVEIVATKPAIQSESKDQIKKAELPKTSNVVESTKKEDNKSKVQSTKPVVEVEKKDEVKKPEIDGTKSVVESKEQIKKIDPTKINIFAQTQAKKEENKSKVIITKPLPTQMEEKDKKQELSEKKVAIPTQSEEEKNKTKLSEKKPIIQSESKEQKIKTEPPNTNNVSLSQMKKDDKKPELLNKNPVVPIQAKDQDKKSDTLKVKPFIQKEQEKPIPKKEHKIPEVISAPPKTNYAKFPEPVSIQKQKEEKIKVPNSAIYSFIKTEENKKQELPKTVEKKIEPAPKKVESQIKEDSAKKNAPKKLEFKKEEPPQNEGLRKTMTITTNKNNKLFTSLRDTLLRNMKQRDKQSESKKQSEPIPVMKSDLMNKMLAAMNAHFEESQAKSSEPHTVEVIECSGAPPPPPPPGFGAIPQAPSSESSINCDPSYIPPPPPPPPPAIFDPSKVPPKKPKPVSKKRLSLPVNASSGSSANSGPSLKEQLMRVSLKKIAKK